MAIELTWLGHASFRLAGSTIVYIDPWKLQYAPRDGDLALISHSHYDHCSKEDLLKAIRPDGQVIAPPDAIEKLGRGRTIAPGQTVEHEGCIIEAVPAYNVNKDFHPKENAWLGFVIILDGVRVYYAGDTDVIDEMDDVGQVDLALLPVGGTYTMTASEAADACRRFDPARAVPYHWGDIVGSRADAERFIAQSGCDAELLEVGARLRVG